MSTPSVCGKTIEECLDTIQQFHGWKAPGLVVGLFMVDLAMARMGKGIEFDAIVESRHCLPDAIQLFTPCTVGNGWLKIVDWDKFALTFYDRHRLTGHRVWLDLEKTRHHPLYHGWFMQTIHKKDFDNNVLLEDIIDAGKSVLSETAVAMTDLHRRNKKGAIWVCASCGEAYSADQGARCAVCQGKGYFSIEDAAHFASSGHGAIPGHPTPDAFGKDGTTAHHNGA